MRLLLAQRPKAFLPYESVKSSFEFYQENPSIFQKMGFHPMGVCPWATWFQASLRDAIPHGMP